MSRAASTAVAAVLAVVSFSFAGCSLGGSPAGAPVVTSPASEASGPSAPHDVATDVATDDATQPQTWAVERLAASRRVVTARLAAASSGDVDMWLRALDDPVLRPPQQALLARMRSIGTADLRLHEIIEAAPPVSAPPGTRVDWDVVARGDYRIAGFDESPRAFSLTITLRADPARTAAATITAWGPTDRPQPWDLDGLRVRRTADALVLATGSPARLDELARRAARAAQRVRAVLGTFERAVWVAPAAGADAAAFLGRSEADLTDVAAATDGPIGVGAPAGADRIVVVPGSWSSLTGEGRDIVLTHELTHATVRRTSTREVPTWLSEGFAEYVAYDAVDLPEVKIVQPAITEVRDAGLPVGLPTTAQLNPSHGRLSAAYGLSLLATRTIASRHGPAALVRFYRAVAGGEPVPLTLLGDPEGVADHLLATVLHTDRHAVVTAWRQRLSRLLAE